MSLTLPRSQTVEVTGVTTDGKETGKIDITTKVGTMIPALTIPDILQLIRNTSVEAAQNIKQNSRYVAETKAGEEVIISQSDGKTGTLTNDPRTMTAEDLEILVATINPEMKGKKYRNLEWDENTETFQDALARKIASFIAVRRTRKNFRAIREMVAAAEDIQTKIVAVTSTAITFKLGAHVEVKAIATADDAYDKFVDAVTEFQRIGTPEAVEQLNIKYAHAEGIGKPDIIVIGSPEFEAKILGKPGVFASESGNALFKQAGIKKILGLDFTSSITLPRDVNFIVVTTGMNGTYGYETVDGGTKGRIVTDPDWSFAKRLDLKDTFSMGVVLPFQIYVSKSK